MKYFFKDYPITKKRLYSIITTFMRYLRGFIILSIFLWLGNVGTQILPIHIPGSIVGLLLLFFMMTCRLIPASWIKESCSILMRYMILLFVPSATGILDHYGSLLNNWIPILLGTIVSSFMALIFIGLLTEHLPNFSQYCLGKLIRHKHKEN